MNSPYYAYAPKIQNRSLLPTLWGSNTSTSLSPTQQASPFDIILTYRPLTVQDFGVTRPISFPSIFPCQSRLAACLTQGTARVYSAGYIKVSAPCRLLSYRLNLYFHITHLPSPPPTTTLYNNGLHLRSELLVLRPLRRMQLRQGPVRLQLLPQRRQVIALGRSS